MSDVRKIRLALVIHNHQPVGNHDSIIERIYRTSYLPFLKKLTDHPQIKASLHYTGFLLEWLEKHHPDFLVLIQKLIDLEQIELLGGAFYEPVISVIPDQDTIGQTNLLTEKIRSLFGVDPTGFWTAERAWEPSLPEVLSAAKISHTVIDDVSFQSSGLEEAGCFEPYRVESRGKFVTVFPILKKLRYYIPFKPVSASIRYLKEATSQNRKIAVYADDGEKFGAWPSTYKRVYADGWLESFFKTVASQKWIESIRLSDYLKENPASKRIYLPASTYSEMMEWAIPLYDQSLKLREQSNDKNIIPLRGFWRLFLAKYPESANLYSKMLLVSSNLHGMGDSADSAPLIDLWKGQCNDAYWHGVFGGLYAPILRKITYEHLIRAQVGYEKQCFGSQDDWISLTESSFGDKREIHIDTNQIGLTILPGSGGAISEIDYKPCNANLLDTLARRPERYHEEIKKSLNRTIIPGNGKSIHKSPSSKGKSLGKDLIYDRNPKFAFVDHLLEINTMIRSFERQDFVELENTSITTYEVEIQKSNLEAVVILTRRFDDSQRCPISLRKTVCVQAGHAKFRVDYEIELDPKTHTPWSSKFIPEINIGTLADAQFNQMYARPLTGSSDQVEISFENMGLRANFKFQGANSHWIIPVKTVSLSEKGFESNLQGITLLPTYRVDLNTETKSFKTSIELDIQTQ